MKRFLFFSLLFISFQVYAADNPNPPDPINFVVNDLGSGMYSFPSANEIPNNSVNYIQNFFTDIQGAAVERNGTFQKESTVLGGNNSVPGLWTFYDNTGIEWLIAYSSRTFYKEQVGGTFTAFGPNTTTANPVYATNNLGKIWFVDGVDNLWWFDGVATGTVASAPIGRYITSWRNRVAIGAITGSQSTVQFSKDGDGLTWTLGPGDSDPFSIQIGGANDGYPITCLYGMFQDTLIVGRKFDLWGTYGFTQSDEQTRKVSSEIGCLQNKSMRENDGDLIWLSARGLEKMNGNGIVLISDPIRDLTDTLVKHTVNIRSNAQTTQADFQAGTISPSGNLSTSISPGNVVLSTMAVIISSDSNAAQFALGTKTNVDTVNGILGLNLGGSSAITVCNNFSSAFPGPFSPPYYQSQSFLATTSYVLASVSVFLQKPTGPQIGNIQLSLYSGTASGGPASLLEAGETKDISTIGSGAPGANYTFGFSSTTELIAGTTYWLQLFNSNSWVYWYKNAGVCHAGESTAINSTISSPASNEFIFTVNGRQYVSPGNFTSRTFDMGVTTQTWLWNWGILDHSSNIKSGTISYQTQSSADGVSWDNPISPDLNTNIIQSTVKRYIRYASTFTTSDPGSTPGLNSVTVYAGPFISTGGIFTSQLITIGNVISSWGPVTYSDIHTLGTITYQFGSTSTASIGAISNWTNIVNGGIPTVSTNPYAAFRSSFVVTSAGANLTLQEFDTSWNEGASPENVAWVWDRRYWLSFTTNTASSPTLDTVLVYQRNKTFTLLKGINASSFTRWRDNLYYGDSTSSGLVYQYDVGNNDNGNSITSIITTKSYDLGYPYRDKDFRTNYIGYLGNSNYTGSFSLNYDIDRSGNAYSLGSINMNAYNGQTEVRFPFSLGTSPTQGHEIQYTLIKAGTGDRLKLYELRTMFALKEPSEIPQISGSK